MRSTLRTTSSTFRRPRGRTRTEAPVRESTAGAGNDNIPFFAKWYGPYSNWDIAQTLTQDTGGASKCLLTTGRVGQITVT